MNRLTHPLKSLLYAEWFLLAIAFFHQWWWPADALSILLNRKLGDLQPPELPPHPLTLEETIAEKIGIILIICLCLGWLWLWRLPKINKWYISAIGLNFLLDVTIMSIGNIQPAWIPQLALCLFFTGFSLFILLGSLDLPTVTINKWLYTIGELLLIWPIFVAGQELSPSKSINFELLLILHLVAIIRSCMLFDGRNRWIAVGVLFCSYHLVSISLLHNWPQIMQEFSQSVTLTPADTRDAMNAMVFNISVTFTLLVGLAVLWVNALTAERQSRQQLALANEQLRQYADQIADRATLLERNRIAREIHDSLGHALTAQTIQLENALLFIESDVSRATGFLDRAQQLSQTALMEVRQSVAKLRHHPLEGQQLSVAIERLVQDLQEKNLHVNADRFPPLYLSIEVEMAIYRIIQESFTNISKHSQADSIDLQFKLKDFHLEIQIIDNGRGFEPAQNTTGFGLQGMQERAISIDALFTIDSSPNQGCKIKLLLPLRSPPNLEPTATIDPL
jgi:signal transduction histidine kinase